MAPNRTTVLRALLFIPAIFLQTSVCVSQDGMRDVLYLKNGSIIKGYIIEQIPDKSLKIQTADGRVFVFDISEIDKIVRESTGNVQVSPGVDNIPGRQFSLLGGVAVPLGDFASTSGIAAAYASTGYCFSGQVHSYLPHAIFVSLSLNLAFNPVDESALRGSVGLPSTVSADISSYSTIMPMVGFGFYAASNPNTIVCGEGLVGLMFGSTPSMKFSEGSVTVTQSSASAIALAVGFQAGVVLSERFTLTARYVTGKPKYKITASGGGMTVNSEFEQPTAMLQFCAGIVL